MENYRMNRAACRPYNNTCGMNKPCRNIRMEMNVPEKEENKSIEEHLSRLPLAMAYVPCQRFADTFQLNYALNVGTIFPELCKPFCGRRCSCR